MNFSRNGNIGYYNIISTNKNLCQVTPCGKQVILKLRAFYVVPNSAPTLVLAAEIPLSFLQGQMKIALITLV